MEQGGHTEPDRHADRGLRRHDPGRSAPTGGRAAMGRLLRPTAFNSRLSLSTVYGWQNVQHRAHRSVNGRMTGRRDGNNNAVK
jgi:hypothetical protein